MSTINRPPANPNSIYRLMRLCILLALTLVTLGGCGGGSGDTNVAANPGIAAPAPAANGAGAATPPTDTVITRITITPGSLLLTELGGTYPLTAQALNESGEAIDVDIQWASNDPDTITVAADGLATAANPIGSALITASVGDVESPPIMALVALPAINTVLVDDEQVIGEPVLVDPDADYELGVLYQVTITDDVAPETGDILLATGNAPVGGQVREVVAQSEGTLLVTLELISLDRMFDNLVIDETFDLSKSEITIPEEISELYDVELQPDGAMVFTLKPEVAVAQASLTTADKGLARLQAPGLPLGPIGTTALFNCNTTAAAMPFNLTAMPALISINPSLSFDFAYNTSMGGLQKLLIRGGVAAEGKAELVLAAALAAKYECKMELLAPIIPIGGPLSLLVSGRVPLGLGVSLEGKINLLRFGIEAGVKATIAGEAGVDCTSGTCESVAKMTDKTLQPSWRAIIPDPSNRTGQLEFAPTASAFGYAELALGPTLVRVIRFTAAEIKLGHSIGLNLGFIERQALDASYKSEYKISGDFTIGTGAEMSRLLALLRVTSTAKLEVKFTDTLTSSPQLQSFAITQAATDIGDTVTATVVLKSDTVGFGIAPLKIYNVNKIRIYKVSGNNSIFVKEFAATANQTEFELSWIATTAEELGQQPPYFAFVDTTLLPTVFELGELELGKAGDGNPTTVTGYWEGSYTAIEPATGNPTGGGLKVSLLQNGTKLTGYVVASVGDDSCSPCEGPAEGTLDGTDITLGTAIQFLGQAQAAFSGTVADDLKSISGIHNYGGTWTLERAIPPENFPTP